MMWLTELWLPILLSAVAVFLLSFVLHMLLPWHKSDYPKLPNEAAVMDALRPLSIPPGDYMAPRPDGPADMKSPEFQEKMKRGPVFMLRILPGAGSMGQSLGMWFVYLLIVAGFAGHIARRALPAGADNHLIFHTVGLSAFLGYALALWQMTIWYRRPVITTFKSTIDGFLYALVTGWIFCVFWPK
jgi:hypothetical protein